MRVFMRFNFIVLHLIFISLLLCLSCVSRFHWNYFYSADSQAEIAPSAARYGLEPRCLVGEHGHRDKSDSTFHVVAVVVVKNDSLCLDSAYWESLIIEDFSIVLSDGSTRLTTGPIPIGERNQHRPCKKEWDFGNILIPNSEDSIRVEFNVFTSETDRDHPIKYIATKVRRRETQTQAPVWLWGHPQ